MATNGCRGAERRANLCVVQAWAHVGMWHVCVCVPVSERERVERSDEYADARLIDVVLSRVSRGRKRYAHRGQERR